MTPSLSIVIPAYDEANRLPATLATIHAYLAARAPRAVELLVVDDGSRDGTAAVARAQGATVISLPANRGKGAAVRAGALAARHARVLVCDADLATPIEALEMLEAALDDGIDIAVGSRRTGTAQPLSRRAFGAAYHAIVRRTFALPVRDTTCGFKLFTRAAAHDLFARSRIDRFAFDVEVLYLARATYRIAEVPVPWHHVGGSRVTLRKDIARTIGELLTIRLRSPR